MSQSPLDQPVTIIASALLPLYLQDAPASMAQPWHAAWSMATPAAVQSSLRLLRQAQVVEQHRLPLQSPCTPHELAYAQARRWPLTKGLLPFAAQQAALQGLTGPADEGWAFVDLVHWAVNQGQVQLRSAGEVSPSEDLAMRQAMQPYFQEDGIDLHPFTPGRWLARSSHFKNLPSVSLSRVLGQDVAYWLDPDSVAAQTPSQRLLRRLQNEMQMLLYTHPINDHRPIAINSFWWSGTGDLPATPSDAPVVLHTDLQTAFAAQDPAQWALAWQQLAQARMAPALLAGHRLVLCGEDRYIGLQSPSHGLWQSLKNLLPQPALKAKLA
jgi:hypothetical protein